MSDPKQVVRAAAADNATCVKHPKNERSEIWMTRLSDQAGLTRVGVNLGRIPPGRESFVPHHHSHHEEWVYVVSGHGIALIGDLRVPIGPGDFLGFPCDRTAHHLINDGNADLVVLQGGERGGGDIGTFPTLDAVGFDDIEHGQMVYVSNDGLERIPFSAWVASGTDEPDAEDC